MTAPFFYKPRPMVGPYGLFILRLQFLWARCIFTFIYTSINLNCKILKNFILNNILLLLHKYNNNLSVRANSLCVSTICPVQLAVCEVHFSDGQESWRLETSSQCGLTRTPTYVSITRYSTPPRHGGGANLGIHNDAATSGNKSKPRALLGNLSDGVRSC